MRVVFGDCEFDSGQRVVVRQGRVVPLSPKAFLLLDLLIDRRPEAVAKTEILDRLWPGVFVSDASLHNLVRELRAALGDSPRLTRYIRTVARYGYAFQADVRPAPPPASVSIASAGPRLVSQRREWELSEGSNLVGRDRGCDVRIESATLSRQHARIVVTGTQTVVEDLGSKNGTLVNGQPVTHPVALEENDQLQLGSVRVTYRTREVLASTLTRRDKRLR
jgi:DNA-binding winged helix-turn-helix (wHTH) protein